MSQKKMIAVLIGAIMVFAGTAMLASTNAMGISEKNTISFSAPTVVGGVVLPAGQYNVTHETSGQTHVMIFQQIGGKKAEAKTTCTLVLLKAKAQQTQLRWVANGKDQRVLQEITFAGDKATHVLPQ